jgi:hypothetical protein
MYVSTLARFIQAMGGRLDSRSVPGWGRCIGAVFRAALIPPTNEARRTAARKNYSKSAPAW